MNGETYLRYLKLFPTKHPSFVLWGHLIMWVAALVVNLYVVGRDYDAHLFNWALACICSIWSIAGIGFWVKMIWSKWQIDKLLKV
jgi:hypothetical protein